MWGCVLFRNQLKHEQNNFEQNLINLYEFDGKVQRKKKVPPNTNYIMLKILKVLTLFEKLFQKKLHRVRTENYQTFFFSIFNVKIEDFLMELESLFFQSRFFLNMFDKPFKV